MTNKQPTPILAPLSDARREMVLLRSAEAPVIFFEGGSSYGVRFGVANLTLAGLIHLTVDGHNVTDVRAVAHLRFPVSALPNLRSVLDGIENMLRQEASQGINLCGASKSNETED